MVTTPLDGLDALPFLILDVPVAERDDGAVAVADRGGVPPCEVAVPVHGEAVGRGPALIDEDKSGGGIGDLAPLLDPELLAVL